MFCKFFKGYQGLFYLLLDFYYKGEKLEYQEEKTNFS